MLVFEITKESIKILVHCAVECHIYKMIKRELQDNLSGPSFSTAA
jgi:hypothetical protein